MTDPHQTPEQAHTHISCSHCDYDLTGLDLQGTCPECGESIISTCFGCDYDLTGLDHSGVCPECGFLIEGSIGRGELAGADPSYLEKLHKGVFIVQVAIIVWILNIFAGFILGAINGASGNPLPASVTIGLAVVLFAVTTAFIIGWWLFSTTEQAYTGSYGGNKERKLVRFILIIAFAFALINAVVSFLPQSIYDNPIFLIFVLIFFAISLGVTVVRFFAEMLYIKWMAPLMRNKKIYNRAKLLMWLGPVLMTFGLLLIGLGPLIALVMYWNMLDWIRKDLKAIRQHNQAIA